jgi:hypothetical protein
VRTGDSRAAEGLIFKSLDKSAEKDIDDAISRIAKQDDSDEVKACVKRKIPILADEHPEWEQDQIVAVAFSMCREASSEKSCDGKCDGECSHEKTKLHRPHHRTTKPIEVHRVPKPAAKQLDGLADREGVTPSDVDAEQLKNGIKVEMEHTSDPKIARQIALDHLTEDPDYYKKLSRMERGLGAALLPPWTHNKNLCTRDDSRP